MAILLLVSQTYDQLLSYVVFCDFLFFTLAAAGLFVLRRREPSPEGAFRAPGHPVTTALFALVSAAVVLNSFVAAPRQATAGCAVLAVGAASYLLARRRTSS